MFERPVGIVDRRGPLGRERHIGGDRRQHEIIAATVEQPGGRLAHLHGAVEAAHGLQGRAGLAAFGPGADIGQDPSPRRLGQPLDIVPRPHAPEIVQPVEHLAGQNRRHLFDHGTGRLETARGFLDGRDHRRVRRHAGADIEHQTDAQALDRLIVQIHPVDIGGRQAHAIAPVGL